MGNVEVIIENLLLIMNLFTAKDNFFVEYLAKIVLELETNAFLNILFDYDPHVRAFI